MSWHDRTEPLGQLLSASPLQAPYLERRFAAGCTSVTRLHRELLAEDAPVSYQMVRAYIAAPRAAAVPEARPPPPTVRRVTGWLIGHRTALSEDVRAALKDVLARCSELDAAASKSATSARSSPAASAAGSPHGLTLSMPANCPASQAPHSACSETSTP
ncbi:hypothetical protein ACWDA7_40140 [Streptomyces sp. NPDC001156]